MNTNPLYKASLKTNRKAASICSVFFLMFFSLILLSPMQLSAQDTATELKAAQKAVRQTESQLKAVNREISSQNRTLKRLDSRLDKSKADFDLLKKKLAQLDPVADKKNVDSISKRVKKLEDEIAALQGQRNTVLLKLTDLSKQKEALSLDVKKQDALISSLNMAIKNDKELVKKQSADAAAKAKAEKDKELAAAKDAKAAAKAEAQAAKAAAREEARAAKLAAKEAKAAPVTDSWTPETPEDQKPALKGDQELGTPAAAEGDVAARPGKIQFDLPMLSGDKEIVEKLKVWKDWAEYVTFNPVSTDEINEFQQNLTRALQEQGYVFANVEIPTKIWGYGIFLAKVDCGKLGEITVKNAKNYSAKQIIRALENQEGKFNYAKIHGDLYDLNVKPDLKLDAQLRPTTRGSRRVVDADIEVEDKLPIHGAVELANTGHKKSNDFRFRTTLQHLNLTKHDDALTFDWLTGADLGESLNAFSMNYFLPLGDDWSISAYGGYNQSKYDSVLPEIGIIGKGHYYGLQLSRTLYESQFERLQLTFGWQYQKTKNHLDIDGTSFNKRATELSMPSITLGYASKVFDKFSGRNFAALTLQSNFAGKYGASEKRQFIENEGPYSEGDFLLAKLQLVRLQRLFGGEETPGKWTLFGKVDAQLADDSLPGAVRSYIGGFNSVRGYQESELGGDNSVVGTLELRTPLVQNFLPGLKKDDEYLQENPKYWGQHRLQFVVFTDYGFVDNKEPYAGQFNNQDFWSVGLGLRLGLTNYSQMSVDYGYPIIDASEDTPSDGRFHISLQLQF